MSIDLYAILGGGRMDTRTELRAAYRRKAKTMHPDVGGDPAAFDQLKLAHDVLTDELRRGRYDRTGEYEATAADNSQGEIYANVGHLLDEVMNAAIQTNADLSKIDVVQAMRLVVQGRINQVTKLRADALRINPILLKTIKRFKRKGKGSNVLAEILAARAGRLGELLDNFRKAEDDANAMLTFLADYKFDMGKPEPVQMSSLLLGWLPPLYVRG